MFKLLLIAVSSCCLLQGCAVLRDPRDAPWDPPQGRHLFEQLPNWDDAARRRCGSHLPDGERERRGLSGSC